MTEQQAESTHVGTAPGHRIKPRTELPYSIGIRSVETCPMELGVDR